MNEVYLGFMDSGQLVDYAISNSKKKIIGIDRSVAPVSNQPSNLILIEDEFLRGLNKVERYVDYVSSELAFGYYDRFGNPSWDHQYTLEIAKRIYSTLSKQSKFHTVIKEADFDRFVELLSHVGFKISNKSVTNEEAGNSPWMNMLKNIHHVNLESLTLSLTNNH